MRKYASLLALGVLLSGKINCQQTKYSVLFNYQRIHPHIQGELYDISKIQSYRNANVRNNSFSLGFLREIMLKNKIYLGYGILAGMKSFSPPGYYTGRLKCFYLNIPLIIRYKWQFNKIQPYFGLGIGNHFVYLNLIKSSMGQILGKYSSFDNIKALSISAVAQAGATLKINNHWGLTFQTEYEQYLTSQVTGSMSIKSSAIGATMGFTLFISSPEKSK